MIINNSKQFGALNMDDLVDFEMSNQINFPADYKVFLIEHNGGVPYPNIVLGVNTDVQVLFGMHQGPYWANFFYHVETFHNRIPSWYVPIGRDSGGNLFLMSLYQDNLGVIAFWDHEREAPRGEADQYFENLVHLADSFQSFLDGFGK